MDEWGLDLAEFFAGISAISSLLTLIGIFFAFLQVREARNGIKAQVLMRLAEEWRSPEVYAAMTYVNRLRSEWRASELDEWPDLASKWVLEHAGKNPQAKNPKERQLWNEWQLRRTASQFLSKMGTLLQEGYIDADDLFGVIPEMGRLLLVLVPIEITIVEHWSTAEGSVAKWDHPVGKWEFRGLWDEYLSWHEKSGSRYVLNWKDWKGIVESVRRTGQTREQVTTD